MTAGGGGGGCPEAGVRLLHLDGERGGGGCRHGGARGRYFGVKGPAGRRGKRDGVGEAGGRTLDSNIKKKKEKYL